MIIDKYCKICNKKIVKRLKETKKVYNNRQYCSTSCSAKSRIGGKNTFYNKKHSDRTKQILSNKTKEQFKNGMPEETRRKISKKNKGRRPHNHIFTKEQIEKRNSAIRKAICGDKHWNWKGGKSDIVAKIRGCNKYHIWRKKVLKNYDNMCTICGEMNEPLHVHHINSLTKLVNAKKIKTLEDAYKYELLWDSINGIAVCEKCHIAIHNNFSVYFWGIEFFRDTKITNPIYLKWYNIAIGENCSIKKGTKIFRNVVINKNVNIGEKCFIGNFVLIRENTNIGNKCIIGGFTKIEWGVSIHQCNNIQGFNTIGETAKIGNNNFISPYVTLPGENEMGGQKDEYKPYPSEIKDNCKIGSHTILLPGHKINDNCIIGAGAVVTKDTESNSLYFGVPAKLIRKIKEGDEINE